MGEAWEAVRPGGRLHPEAFLASGGHVAVEVALLCVIAALLLRRRAPAPRRGAGGGGGGLTPAEVADLVAEWRPEPVVPASGRRERPALRTVHKVGGGKVELGPAGEAAGDEGVAAGGRSPVRALAGLARGGGSGARETLLDLVSTSFLGLEERPEIRAACRGAIDKYGCGSCGPRGFYGTVDVHLELEERFASFMGVEAAILYSFDIATPLSTIPAFCKAGDLIIMDEGCSYAVRQGVELSRARVRTFKHNDAADLERVLKEVDAENARRGRQKLKLRFIVVEGVYADHGDVPPLPEIVALKERFKYRLMIEESFSLGTLGTHGRGVCEHFGLEPSVADMIFAGLGNAFASVGGICLGGHVPINHQRLAGAGYVFSASLPPFLAVASVGAIDALEAEPSLVPTLRSRSAAVRRELRRSPHLHVVGDEDTPLIHVRLANRDSGAKAKVGTRKGSHGKAVKAGAEGEGGEEDDEAAAHLREEAALEALVADVAKTAGVLVSVAQHSSLAPAQRPSLKLAVTLSASEDDLVRAAQAIVAAAKRACT